jgi:alpha-tubulin N-acetyltransferase 1
MELLGRASAPASVAVYDARCLGGFSGRVCATHAIAPTLDCLGELSAAAQHLPAAITSANKLCANPGQRCYVLFDQRANTAVGLIKVGQKRLFIMRHDQMLEMEPLCVLDFYVHESQQRRGAGSQLFEHMLSEERASPQRLAYDRPSHKLLQFLQRHYCLRDFTPQANNFVVYNDYWDGGSDSQPRPASTAAAGSSTSRQGGQQYGSGGALDWAAAAAEAEGSRGGGWGGVQGGGSDGSTPPPTAAASGAAAPRPGRSFGRGGVCQVVAPPSRGGQSQQAETSQHHGAPAVSNGQAQLEVMALHRIAKAAANAATSTEDDVDELRALVGQALQLGLTTAEQVHVMATNLARGRSSVSYHLHVI